MALLTLEKELIEAKLRSPRSHFAIDLQPIEYRRDPLTGMRSRINKRRAERMRQAAMRTDTVSRVAGARETDCAFCPENIERMTPRFPSQFIPEGRIRTGSAVLFPNLYPFSEYHSVSVFSGAHSLPLGSFSANIIRDCIRACVDYLMRVRDFSPDVRHGSINWNYMPPAGASIVHPHLQVLADRSPMHLQEILIQRSEEYFRKHGSNYWRDLVETEEKLEERLVHRGDDITWLASFAPRANDEVMAVFRDCSSITQIDERGLAELSSGISAVLKGYSKLGVESLNMSVISGPLDSGLESYALNLRMNSRPRLQRYYTNDCGFMERILLESIIESNPEEVASRLRDCFKH